MRLYSQVEPPSQITWLSRQVTSNDLVTVLCQHCYPKMQGVARFYKAKKKHIITTQTVSGRV